jgi:hypothetical protein
VDFAAPENATYKLVLRIWDEVPSNPISTSVDGSYVRQLRYNGTLTAVNATVFSGPLARGVHKLTISVDDQPGMSQYMSLDYIAVQESKS